jgi:putative oxidoreductase
MATFHDHQSKGGGDERHGAGVRGGAREGGAVSKTEELQGRFQAALKRTREDDLWRGSMTAGQAAARAMIAAVFIHGGAATWNDPAPRARAASPLLRAVRRAAPFLPSDTSLVQVNAAVQIAAGTLLAAGAWPARSATVLAASLVPTTIAGHPFWAAQDPALRAGEMMQFGKNLAIMGGLLLLVRDQNIVGRPGRVR